VLKKLVVGLFLLWAIPALADQVLLKNGDRLTGYVSNPPSGTKKNDLQLATGLNFSFRH
jgi:hypothetical protein